MTNFAGKQQKKMTLPEFGDLLVEASAHCFDCGLLIEKELKNVLTVADKCTPEVALVTADTLTKLTRDIGAVPLYFSEKMKADGMGIRNIVQVLAAVLRKVKPQSVRCASSLRAALEASAKACKKYGLGADAELMFGVLVKEIARVFYELRGILKRQKGMPSKRLFNCIKDYIRRISQPILCFGYNTVKLRVCLESVSACGAKSVVSKAVLRKVLRNIKNLTLQTRTLAVAEDFHKATIQKALELAKKPDM